MEQKKRKLLDLREIVDCPVCLETLLPPVYQCCAGHLLCGTCKSKLTQCPTCSGSLGGAEGIRSRGFEQLAETLSWECKFKDKGCKMTPSYSEKKVHEDQCQFRPLTCPRCEWTGDVLYDHLQKDHHYGVTKGPEINLSFGCKFESKAQEWNRLLDCGDVRFLLQGYKEMGKELYIWIQHLNSPLSYVVEVLGPNGRKWTYTGPTRSIRDGEAVRTSHDCLMLSDHIVRWLCPSSVNSIRISGTIGSRGFLQNFTKGPPVPPRSESGGGPGPSKLRLGPPAGGDS